MLLRGPLHVKPLRPGGCPLHSLQQPPTLPQRMTTDRHLRRPLTLRRFKEDDVPETPLLKTAAPSSVHVLFQLHKKCAFGEAWGVVGSQPELGAWDPNRALLLKWSQGDTWSAQVPLPRDTKVEFKFVLLDANSKKHKKWLSEELGTQNLSLDLTEGAALCKSCGNIKVIDCDKPSVEAASSAAASSLAASLPFTSVQYAVNQGPHGTPAVVPVDAPTKVITPSKDTGFSVPSLTGSFKPTTPTNPLITPQPIAEPATGVEEFPGAAGFTVPFTGSKTAPTTFSTAAADSKTLPGEGDVGSAVPRAAEYVSKKSKDALKAATKRLEDITHKLDGTSSIPSSSSLGSDVEDRADPANQMVMTPSQLKDPHVLHRVVNDSLTTDTLLAKEHGASEDVVLEPTRLPHLDTSSLQYRPSHLPPPPVTLVGSTDTTKDFDLVSETAALGRMGLQPPAVRPYANGEVITGERAEELLRYTDARLPPPPAKLDADAQGSVPTLPGGDTRTTGIPVTEPTSIGTASASVLAAALADIHQPYGFDIPETPSSGSDSDDLSGRPRSSKRAKLAAAITDTSRKVMQKVSDLVQGTLVHPSPETLVPPITTPEAYEAQLETNMADVPRGVSPEGDALKPYTSTLYTQLPTTPVTRQQPVVGYPQPVYQHTHAQATHPADAVDTAPESGTARGDALSPTAEANGTMPGVGFPNDPDVASAPESGTRG